MYAYGMYAVVCLARTAAKLSHVGWRLTRQVPKGRRNSGVREAGLEDENVGPTKNWPMAGPKASCQLCYGPLGSWRAR